MRGMIKEIERMGSDGDSQGARRILDHSWHQWVRARGSDVRALEGTGFPNWFPLMR